MDLTHDDVKKILHIVDNAPHIDEIEYRPWRPAFSYLSQRASTPRPSNQLPPVAGLSIPSGVERPATSRAGRERGHGNAEIFVRGAPVVGIFLRSPASDHPLFVEAGRMVRTGDKDRLGRNGESDCNQAGRRGRRGIGEANLSGRGRTC